MSEFSITEYSKSCVQDYLDGGMYDHFQDPELFAEYMSERTWVLSEYYVAGITKLEEWYGDKAYRKYGDWFEILDYLLDKTEELLWK